MDGRQTQAEVRGLAYVFETLSEIIYFRLSMGSAFKEEATTVCLEGPNLESLQEEVGTIHLSKGKVDSGFRDSVDEWINYGLGRRLFFR